jgi:hypothetical protein
MFAGSWAASSTSVSGVSASTSMITASAAARAISGVSAATATRMSA